MFRMHLMIIAFSLLHVACDAQGNSDNAPYLHMLKEELIAWIKHEINQADTKDDRLEYGDMVATFYFSHFDQETEEFFEAIRRFFGRSSLYGMNQGMIAQSITL